MSAYITLKTPMVDETCLIAAIEDAGVKRSALEISTQPVPLRGWRRDQMANIILRKEITGDAFNDVGFLSTPTGYTAILSDDHPRFGRAWLNRIHEHYKARWAEKERMLAEAERQKEEEKRRALVEAQRIAVHQRAKKLGYRVKESREGEIIRLVLVKRSY